MSENAALTNRSEHAAALQRALEQTAKLLADQAPLRVFIYMNPLVAFQHLPFHEAVTRAQDVLGAEPYWPEARFREKLAQGRITEADLETALDDQFPEDAELADGLLSERALRLLMLRHAVHDETTATLRWRIQERGLLARLRDDVSAEARERFLGETTKWLRHALEVGNESKHGFGRLVTGATRPEDVQRRLESGFAVSSDPTELRTALETRPEKFCVPALWNVCLERTAGIVVQAPPRKERLRLHRELLLEAGGEDVFNLVFPVLIRQIAAFLDEGVAYWPMPDRELGFYASTRKLLAERASSPVRWVKAAHEAFRTQLARNLSATDAILEILDDLGVRDDQTEPYVTALLLSLPGWASMVSRLERNPGDRPPNSVPASLLDLLAVRLTYERAALVEAARERLGKSGSIATLFRDARASEEHPREGQHPSAFRLFQIAQLAGLPVPRIQAMSDKTLRQLLLATEAFDSLTRRRLFQEAFERHHHQEVLNAVAAFRAQTEIVPARHERPRFQVVSCFDDREESIRRHIEEVAPDAQTFGAPGFFGAAIRFRGIDETAHVALCPPVVTPTHLIEELPHQDESHIHVARMERRRRWAQLQHGTHTGSRSLWRGLVLNAALGVVAAIPLLTRILSPRVAGRIRRAMATRFLPTPRTEITVHHDESRDLPPGVSQRGFKADERVTRIATVLENIGMTAPLAKLVLVLGHGATTLNNPHRASYDCGACGGRQGGPNARIFCHMANDPEVRAGLRARGHEIPEDTWFVGGQHDTCNDMITFADTEHIPESHRALFESVRAQLQTASERNAQERCRRLFSAPRNMSPEAAYRHVEERSEHLAQPRPEFGHATHSVAVVGRRSLTRGLFMDRRAFLLSYDPTIDHDGAILERTLAAAVPVGAGINLTYYFSSVDSERHGAGSKLPHNVTGLFGVMSGHASDLRTGLPRQSIDIHEPMRLLMLVEATPERLLEIAGRQAEVRELVVNRWAILVSVHPETGAMQVLTDRGFEPYTPQAIKLPVAATSPAFCLGSSEILPFGRIVRAA